MLKLEEIDRYGRHVWLAGVNVNDTWVPLKKVREFINQRTGLTGLALVCEGSYVVESEPRGHRWELIGHDYWSNDDCSNYPTNYIRGVRMQYDIDKPIRFIRPGASGEDRPPTSLGTMIFNFATACTRDFSESVRLENFLRFIPNIPGGIKYCFSN